MSSGLLISIALVSLPPLTRGGLGTPPTRPPPCQGEEKIA